MKQHKRTIVTILARIIPNSMEQEEIYFNYGFIRHRPIIRMNLLDKKFEEYVKDLVKRNEIDDHHLCVENITVISGKIV